FPNSWIDRTILNKGSSGMFDERPAQVTSRSDFSHLTGATDNRILMAIGTTDRVVDGPKAIGNGLPVLEQLAIAFKHLLAEEAVRFIVESRRGQIARNVQPSINPIFRRG